MSNRSQISEQILRLLEGGTPSNDTPWDLREIRLLVDQSVAYNVKLLAYDALRVGDKGVGDQFIITYSKVPVKKDEDRKIFYVNAPSKYINLPGNSGLRSVGPMGNEFDKFIPIGMGGLNFRKSHAGPFLQGNVGYWAEGSMIMFDKDMSDLGIKEVVIQVLTTDSDDFEIPIDIERDVIEYVYKLMSSSKQKDDLSDNNDVQRQLANKQ